LLVVAMLTVVVVGFNAATRTEQMAARNFSKLSAGRTMVTTAQQQAAVLLSATLTNTNHGLVTQPGRALVWDDAGTITTNPLSSEGVPGVSGELVNLNATGAIAGTNAAFVSYFNVPWVYVTNEVNGTNQVVGRYAFWIDDDGSRLNLNYAGTAARANKAFYPTNPRPFDARMLEFSSANVSNVFLNGLGSSLTDRSSSPRTNSPTWGYFFHPRQIRSYTTSQVPSLWPSLRYQVAAGVGNMTNTNMAPSVLGRQVLVPGFLGATASIGSVDGFIAQRIDGPLMRARFGGQTFTTKYTVNGLRQIAANINDFPLGASGNPFGATLLDPTESVPRFFAALRPFPHLNEVAVRPYYAVNPNDGRIEIQVYLGAELINPYPAALGAGARLYFDLQRFDFTGTFEKDGKTNSFTGGTNPWPRSGIFVASPITVSNALEPKSYMGSGLFYRWEWSVNTGGGGISNVRANVNFQLRTIQFSQTTNPATMRDWATSTDLPLWSFAIGSANGDSNSVFYGFGNTGPLPALPGGVNVSDGIARGVAKNDPRVRTFPGWGGTPNVAAWTAVGDGGPNITLGSNNSVVNFKVGTGTASNLPNDEAPAGNVVFEHPSFASRDRSQPTSWLSGFELGEIHTGLQWRTLHLHSQNTNEGNLIPDWALLDVFAVSNAFVPVASRPNPNAMPFPAMTNGLTTNDLVSRGLSRQGAYAALLSGFTSGNDPDGAQLLLGGALTNAGLLDSLNIPDADVRTAGRNLATMRFSAGWTARRAALPAFPINAYGSLAEIVEVDGVGNRGASKLEKEQNARVVYESLSPFSDTFTVFAIGQGLEVTTIGGKKVTNVIGEASTMSQLKFDSASGKARAVYTWPLNAP